MRKPSAFTLIELLIVVAIIAILAAIAVPNFLEAQTRSKVSRAKADMRTLVTALESYAVDNNKFPDELRANLANSPFTGTPLKIGTDYSRKALNRLTTPIAYLSTAQFADPFAKVGENPADPQNTDYFGYANCAAAEVATDLAPITGGAATAANKPAFDEHGFVLQSVGPDTLNYAFQNPVTGQGFAFAYLKLVNMNGATGSNFFYDPTNGTISTGDIVRTRKINY